MRDPEEEGGSAAPPGRWAGTGRGGRPGSDCHPVPLQEFVWEASHYLVRQVFNSLQEMFSGTRAIQVRPLSPPQAQQAAPDRALP